jgi:hypothetical protein
VLAHLISLYIINFVLVKKYKFIESTKIKFIAYKKALLNPYSFDYLSFTGKEVEAPELGVFLGNPKASNRILLISSPSCRFCSDYMLDLLSLVRANANIYVQILFLCRSAELDGDEKLVNYFLNLQKNESPPTLYDALYYWVLKKPALHTLLKAFPLCGIVSDFKADIEKMASWCTVQSINAVPELYINGRPLPYIYDIKDLKFVLK